MEVHTVRSWYHTACVYGVNLQDMLKAKALDSKNNNTLVWATVMVCK